jgi:hypothetical protein
MSKGKVEINITKQQYDFIDGATGEKISPEEFAKRYPSVGIGRSAISNGNKTINAENDGKEQA